MGPKAGWHALARRGKVERPEYLETTVDKFVFRVMADRYYHESDTWAKVENGTVRVGGSDFLQKKNGDVAFVEPRARGTRVAQGEEFGQIETIKALVSLVSPVTGEIIEVNGELEARPELVNEDPYGEGWIVRIKAEDFARDRERLLEPGGYFVLMQEKIKEELGKKK